MVTTPKRKLQPLRTGARVTVALIGVAAAAAIAAPGAATAPERCNLGARNTIKGYYRVAFVACPGRIAIGQPTDWTIRVTTRPGAAVRGALEVTGGMPEHGHGFLTPPVVSRGQRAGEYHARLVFAMGGRWVVEFRIRANGRRDVVRYQLTV